MLEKIVKKIIKANPQTREDFLRLKREFFYQYRLRQIPNKELLKLYNKLVNNPNQKSKAKEIFKKKKIRTLSGVAPVAILTKSAGCPHHCVYCPTESRMPKSYLSNEPAVMRAILCGFHPYRQVIARLKALEENGHDANKIEIIVMGGTWSALPLKYQYWFIKEVFRAANEYGRKKNNPSFPQDDRQTLSGPGQSKISEIKKELLQEQKKNEKARYRIVGLTLETRPDYITTSELKKFRVMGCTRVEIGVQSVNEEILKKIKRGHGTKEIQQATYLLRRAGFKIVYHLMPNLPGATPDLDLKMFKEIFSNPAYCPDQIKIYPCVVVQGSELYSWWKKGKFQPYSDKVLQKLLLEIKKIVPYWVRIVRLIRDIPSGSIEAGNKTSNLRQILQEKLAAQGQSCGCLRCREAREQPLSSELTLYQEKYPVSSGQEIFLSWESSDRKVVYAFLRLHLPDPPQDKKFFQAFPELKQAALIREVHTYGQLTPFSQKKGNVQHKGLGKKLVKKAEQIAQENGFSKMAVISGVGVRGYYRKLGYRRQGTYMVKKLAK